MAHFLCSLFQLQKILDSGVTPDAWRIAQVSPVHKGHNARADVLSSYRPIANTSIVCRTFERVLNAKIQTHIEEHGLLSPAQHAFRRNLTSTALWPDPAACLALSRAALLACPPRRFGSCTLP
ncbi:hypothetical protein HPB48_023602 [Haemaphysalis longicornis]|uniref:Uncharacterized protein n=1 Tax=Haemaphysalis longicornis TaxID=44386 RepID=A0A9J6H8B1_HAELO|nr:hypothetical protein HPB48_023602 [Haemaphysalis longicornis]